MLTLAFVPPNNLNLDELLLVVNTLSVEDVLKSIFGSASKVLAVPEPVISLFSALLFIVVCTPLASLAAVTLPSTNSLVPTAFAWIS